MKRVTGIGGIFFKSKDSKNLQTWYEKHLGFEPDPEGYILFKWLERDKPHKKAHTVWGLFPEDTDYFEPSKASFMINYRVENLDKLLEQLRDEGVEVSDQRIDDEINGKFGFIMDPEGNRIQLWEPSEKSYEV
jgi:predicted enzyme related to lactoylglutathione lyase